MFSSARAKQKQPKLPETIEEKSAGYDDETMSGYLKHSYNWLDGKMEWTLGEMKLAWDGECSLLIFEKYFFSISAIRPVQPFPNNDEGTRISNEARVRK